MSTIQARESEFTRCVVERLTRLRFRWLTVNLLTAMMAVLTCLGCLWLAMAAMDYTFELTHGVRQNVALIVALIGIAGSAVLMGLVVRSGNVKDLIRRLEVRFPDFGQRLRTVFDIHEGRFDAPAPMQRVLGNQTLARWETSAPNQMIAYQRLWQLGVVATALVAFLCASLAMDNQWSLALRRSMGLDIPYTVFSVEPGSIEVLEGTEVSLGLKLEGRLGRKVTGRWRKVDEDPTAVSKESWIENGLEPVEKAVSHNVADYVLALGKLRESVEYQFETSIGVSETYRIKVRPLVQVTEVKTTVVPPAYTKATTRVFKENEVTALSGSEVTIQWLVSQPLTKLAIKIEERDLATRIVEALPTEDPSVWQLILPSERTLKWQTDGVGYDGTPLEVAKGRLRIREDAAPHITWKKGNESIEVHTLAEVPLHIAVSDDFAVASAQIIIQFADGGEQVLAELDPEQVSDMSRIDLESILQLEKIGLTQRDYLGFYAVAKDNCEPSPRSAATDVRFIDIRPLRQKFREEDAMPGEPNGKAFESLVDLMKSQRLLINQTRRLIQLPAEALADQIKNIDRMVQTQSELARNTAFLADFLVARGNDDVESLRQAEAAMLQAADSLAAGIFDTALLQELDALRWLVETRNELEKILIKNPKMAKSINAAMASLKMKLRRTRPPTALEIAAQLEQIANEQEKLTNKVVRQDKSDEDAVEKNVEQQSELVTNLNDIATQVAKQTWPSKVIPERMNQLVKTIANAERHLKQQSIADYEPDAEGVSDEARELAAHIRASNPDEPLETLASLAAMAQQASKMESELALAMQNSMSPSSISSESTSSSASSGSGASGASTEPGTNGQGTRMRMSKRIAARAETIEDVIANLKAPGSNKEASEAAAQLESWLEQAEFRKTLADSKEAAAKGESNSGAPEPKEGGTRNHSEKEQEGVKNRSAEYMVAAEFMNDLYRQLASPRLEQLRKLEAKARELQAASEESTEKSGGKSDTDTESSSLTESEIKAGTKELEQLLERAGLEEISEVLRKQGSGESGSITYRGFGNIPIGLRGTVRALRFEIQAIIMEQISVDRNMPVPQNYVEAVDRYFESISSPIEEGESLR